MAKQKIVSIEIELKDYEPIKFTMDEARELHEQLDALFGEKTENVHHYHDRWWNRPYYSWTAGNLVGDNTTTGTFASDAVGGTVVSNTTDMKVSYLAS